MRRFDRRRAAFAVTVRTATSKVEGAIHLDSADFSEGGAFLRSELLFEVGDTLELEIPMPSGVVVRATGKVARVSREPGAETPPGMGIEFVHLTPDDRRALLAALIRAGASSKPPAGKPDPPT
jgi:hypothetical protein